MASLITYVPFKVVKENAIKALIIFMSFYSGIFLLVLIIIDRLVVGNIIKPVEHLAEVAERMSMGDLKVKIDIKSKDEIGLLAQALDRMQTSLNMAMARMRRRK